MDLVTHTHFCDLANKTDNGKINIIGIFSKIVAASVPAVHPNMYLVVGLKLKKGTHEIDIKNGKESILKWNLENNGNEPQDYNQIIQLTNVIIESFGAKKFEIFIDKKKKGVAEFEVTKTE